MKERTIYSTTLERIEILTPSVRSYFLRLPPGQKLEFSAGQFPATVAELLKHLNIEAATVVAEVDGKIIEREKFADTALSRGQAIELVRFVPGG